MRCAGALMSDFFNQAYGRAQSRFTSAQWLALSPREVTEAIYQAIRELDAAHATTPPAAAAPPDPPDRRDSAARNDPPSRT